MLFRSKKFRAEVDDLIKGKVNKEDAMFTVIRKYIIESKRIRFEGNSYSEEWINEAAKRGLSNIPDTPHALKSLLKPEVIQMFIDHDILTEREVRARYEIKLENYIRKIQIESRVLGDLAINHIIPIAIRYQNLLIDNVKGLKEVLDNKTFVALSKNQLDTIKEISEHIAIIKEQVQKMVEARKEVNKIESPEDLAIGYQGMVLPFFEEIRYHADKLELMVDNELWPLPKYRELMFIR